MTVASLNLHGGVSSSGRPFSVTAALCQLDAAIICAQEAWKPSAANRPDEARRGHRTGGSDRTSGSHGDGSTGGAQQGVLDQLPYAAARLGMAVHRAVLCDRPAGELAIAVLTALPVAGYDVIELGTAPGDTIPRLAQVLLLELPDEGRLRLVHTHLTHRFVSPVQLARIQRQLKPGFPTIIVGDLNMPRIITARWPGYAELIRGRTFPAGRPLVQPDHVLASRGIQRVSGRVLPPAGSDHLPVRAEIRVPRAH